MKDWWEQRQWTSFLLILTLRNSRGAGSLTIISLNSNGLPSPSKTKAFVVIGTEKGKMNTNSIFKFKLCIKEQIATLSSLSATSSTHLYVSQWFIENE